MFTLDPDAPGSLVGRIIPTSYVHEELRILLGKHSPWTRVKCAEVIPAQRDEHGGRAGAQHEIPSSRPQSAFRPRPQGLAPESQEEGFLITSWVFFFFNILIKMKTPSVRTSSFNEAKIKGIQSAECGKRSSQRKPLSMQPEAGAGWSVCGVGSCRRGSLPIRRQQEEAEGTARETLEGAAAPHPAVLTTRGRALECATP